MRDSGSWVRSSQTNLSQNLELQREDGKAWGSFDSEGDQSLVLIMDRSVMEFDKRALEEQGNKSKDDCLSGMEHGA